MYKKVWCTCRVVILPFFLFLPSSSSLLKLPTREFKRYTFLIHKRPGWPRRTGSGTLFTRQMQIIKQSNVKPSLTPRQNYSFENVFQRFAWSFVSFLRRKHDFRRWISTFVWRILFEEPRIWTSGLNQPENSRFEDRYRNSRTSWHAQWLSCCKNTSGWRPWYQERLVLKSLLSKQHRVL